MLDGEEIVQIACNKTCDMDAKHSAIGHSWERNVFPKSIFDAWVLVYLFNRVGE